MKPINYQLQFEPNLKTFTFQGHELLTFQIKEPADSIQLDSVDLTIQTCELKNSDYTISQFKNEKKLLHITFNKKLPNGTYKLEITFSGELKGNLSGFYRSKVESVHEEFIATTQFEPADARHAFPCVDHPSYKAQFDITMIVDKDLTALSNSLVKTEEILSDGRKKITFETTPVMSTYLLYLGAGRFEMIEESYKDITIRGITTTRKAKYTKFAIDCARKSLEYFENYFGIPYPLKKLDLIAVPDFAAGAMENWGAITFRENLVLFYEESSSVATKQRIAEVVAHEVAHQWFGNLVTMKWWDDLWLNESFATFMAYKVTAHYWPDWNVWIEYLLGRVYGGTKLDSLKSSHPIKVEVNDISETNELFDEIAYDKGGGILRMIEGYLGETEFRDGLRLYMQTFKYSNTEASNLWNCLEKSSGKPISAAMDSQINQTGFPVIAVTQKDDTLTLTQSRFLMTGDAKDNQVWKIPMTMKIGEDIQHLIIENETSEIEKDTIDFIFLNKDANGFFISQYSPELLKKLGEHIHKLEDIEKIGLIHDLEKLVFAGKMKLKEFTKFLADYFAEEKSTAVLLFMTGKLHKMYMLLKNTELGELLKDHAKLSIKLIGYNPIAGEHPYTTFLRSSAISSLALFDDADVKKFTLDQFSRYLKDDSSLHPDLRALVFALAVWFDDTNYEIILNKYKQSTNIEEKGRFLSALGNTKNKDLIQKSLAYALSNDVRFNQMPAIIFSVAGNPFGKEAAFDWMVSHWNDIKVKAHGTINHIFRNLLKVIIPSCGIGRMDEVKKFIKVTPTPELTRTFDQVLEELGINDAFINRNT